MLFIRFVPLLFGIALLISASLGCSFWFYYSFFETEPGSQGSFNAFGYSFPTLPFVAGCIGCAAQLFVYSFTANLVYVKEPLFKGVLILISTLTLALTALCAYSTLIAYFESKSAHLTSADLIAQQKMKVLESRSADIATISRAADQAATDRYRTQSKTFASDNERLRLQQLADIETIAHQKEKPASPLDGLIRIVGHQSLVPKIYCAWLAITFDLLPILGISLLSRLRKQSIEQRQVRVVSNRSTDEPRLNTNGETIERPQFEIRVDVGANSSVRPTSGVAQSTFVQNTDGEHSTRNKSSTQGSSVSSDTTGEAFLNTQKTQWEGSAIPRAPDANSRRNAADTIDTAGINREMSVCDLLNHEKSDASLGYLLNERQVGKNGTRNGKTVVSGTRPDTLSNGSTERLSPIPSQCLTTDKSQGVNHEVTRRPEVENNADVGNDSCTGSILAMAQSPTDITLKTMDEADGLHQTHRPLGRGGIVPTLRGVRASGSMESNTTASIEHTVAVHVPIPPKASAISKSPSNDSPGRGEGVGDSTTVGTVTRMDGLSNGSTEGAPSAKTVLAETGDYKAQVTPLANARSRPYDALSNRSTTTQLAASSSDPLRIEKNEATSMLREGKSRNVSVEKTTPNQNPAPGNLLPPIVMDLPAQYRNLNPNRIPNEALYPAITKALCDKRVALNYASVRAYAGITKWQAQQYFTKAVENGLVLKKTPEALEAGYQFSKLVRYHINSRANTEAAIHASARW